MRGLERALVLELVLELEAGQDWVVLVRIGQGRIGDIVDGGW